MTTVLLNPKKNSDLKRIGMIGTRSANMDINTVIMIFLLQHCSEEVYDARKSKIKIWTEKEWGSSSLNNKIEKPDVLTVDAFSVGKPGHDFSNIEEVLKAIKKESTPIIALLISDAKNHLIALQKKYEKNPEQFCLSAIRTLLERKTAIAECLKEFEKQHSEKSIAVNGETVTLAGLKSKQDITLVHLIGHQNLKKNIVAQRHVLGHTVENVISFDEQAKKYKPGILERFCMREPTGWFEHEQNGMIYSNPNNITQIPFNTMMDEIEKAVQEFELAQSEATQTKIGNSMAKEAMHITHEKVIENAYTQAPTMA